MSEVRVPWALALIVVAGGLPGVLLGTILRVTLFASPGAFRTFVGLVLLYLGGRLLWEVATEIRSDAEETGLTRQAQPHDTAGLHSGYKRSGRARPSVVFKEVETLPLLDGHGLLIQGIKEGRSSKAPAL